MLCFFSMTGGTSQIYFLHSWCVEETTFVRDNQCVRKFSSTALRSCLICAFNFLYFFFFPSISAWTFKSCLHTLVFYLFFFCTFVFEPLHSLKQRSSYSKIFQLIRNQIILFVFKKCLIWLAFSFCCLYSIWSSKFVVDTFLTWISWLSALSHLLIFVFLKKGLVKFAPKVFFETGWKKTAWIMRTREIETHMSADCQLRYYCNYVNFFLHNYWLDWQTTPSPFFISPFLLLSFLLCAYCQHYKYLHWQWALTLSLPLVPAVCTFFFPANREPAHPKLYLAII